MNICLVSWYYSANYGTCIQCYALVNYLKKNGYNVFVPDTYRYYYGFNHPFETFNKCVSYITKKIKAPNSLESFSNLSENIKKDYIERIDNNKRFGEKECSVVKMTSKKEFKKLISSCDVFMTGSDQIWNPDFVSPPFLLSFVPKSKKKISYGSSLGVSKITDNGIYKKYLTKFDKISVREYTAKTIIENITHKKCEVVLDPSFLIDKEDWEELAKKSKLNLKKKYILTYFIGKNDEWENYIKNYSLDERIIINILSESYIIPKLGISSAAYSVEDFIYLIKNAECIITDSFHACVISIILNRNFGVFKRFKDGTVRSQNSRIVDLLNLLNLNERLVNKESDLQRVLNTQIEYCDINEIVNEKIKESKDFLNNELNVGLC